MFFLSFMQYLVLEPIIPDTSSNSKNTQDSYDLSRQNYRKKDIKSEEYRFPPTGPCPLNMGVVY